MAMLVVIDTNILVSALWSKNGAPAALMSLVLNGVLVPCYDHRIMQEYREVLSRPKFGFSKGEVNAPLDWIKHIGRSVVPPPLEIPFTDEADKKFYEVAKYTGAPLVTGNRKHFPEDPQEETVSDFLSGLRGGV